jgi:hypothetical protein
LLRRRVIYGRNVLSLGHGYLRGLG